jgi:hypothetical protein
MNRDKKEHGKSTQRKPLLIRIDEALWLKIRKWAQEERRSVNAQITYLLRESIRRKHERVESGEDTK